MPLIKALFCQILAAIIVFLLIKELGSQQINGWFWIFAQALVALVFSIVLRQPSWWRLMHLLFLPAMLFMLSLQLPAWIYLLGFLLLSMIFWGTVSGDVPLFLSSQEVVNAVQAIVINEQAASFVDIGAGIGTVIMPLGRQFPSLRILGLERAPMPWLLAIWRCRRLANVEIRLASIWTSNLTDYAVVFAFLSPSVMERVGVKILPDMSAGSLFISAAFPIPDWVPESIVAIADRRKTILYCYRIPQ